MYTIKYIYNKYHCYVPMNVLKPDLGALQELYIIIII